LERRCRLMPLTTAVLLFTLEICPERGDRRRRDPAEIHGRKWTPGREEIAADQFDGQSIHQYLEAVRRTVHGRHRTPYLTGLRIVDIRAQMHGSPIAYRTAGDHVPRSGSASHLSSQHPSIATRHGLHHILPGVEHQARVDLPHHT